MGARERKPGDDAIGLSHHVLEPDVQVRKGPREHLVQGDGLVPGAVGEEIG